jgi:hypothetical protein
MKINHKLTLGPSRLSDERKKNFRHKATLNR